MEARSRVVAGAFVVLAASLGAWFAFANGTVDAAPPPAAGASDTGSSVRADVVENAVASSSTPAAEPPAESPASAPGRSEIETPDPANAILRGRCVDPAGAPLAGCAVRLHGWVGNDMRLEAWRKDHGEPDWEDPPAVTTGADGRFEFAFWPPPPFQFMLDFTRDGCGAMNGRWPTLAERSVTDVGDVAMAPGVTVGGRVVDENGVPQEGIYVLLNRSPSEPRAARPKSGIEPRWGGQAFSAADGTFSFRRWMVPGEYQVDTQGIELQSPKTIALTADRPHEDMRIVVRRPPPTETISGIVLDETGAPARGVEIEHRSGFGEHRASATSGRDGRFELRRAAGDVAELARLTLSAGLFDVEPGAAREVKWGSHDVEFRVARAGALTVRVTDQGGTPVENYLVRLVPRNRGRHSSADSRARAQGRHEDGTVVIPGLTRGDWLLIVEFPSASGFDAIRESFRHEATAPRRMDLRAVPPARRMLRVVDGQGVPVAGSKVQLCDPLDQPFDDARMVMTFDLWLINSGSNAALVLAEGETDATGRFELRGPGGRELGVCLLGPGHVPLRRGGIRLDAEGECEIRVGRGARLTGKVVPPEAIAELRRLAGGDADGAFPARRAARLGLRNARNERFPRDHLSASKLESLRIRDDGTFDVPGLPPGPWMLELQTWITHGQVASSRALQVGDVVLVDGETVERDLDLTMVLPGTVAGTVLLNGAPFGNGTVSLHGGETWINCRTDAEGRFEQTVFPGDYRISVQKPREDRYSKILHCPTPIRVVRGQTTEQTFAVASSTLRLSVLGSDGKAVVDARVHAVGDDAEPIQLPPTDAAGVTEHELTTGTVTLRILPQALASPEAQQKLWREAQARGDRDPLAPHWVVLQTVSLSPGQQSDLELRLPTAAGY